MAFRRVAALKRGFLRIAFTRPSRWATDMFPRAQRLELEVLRLLFRRGFAALRFPLLDLAAVEQLSEGGSGADGR